ncbi:hypothetical protein OG735_07930 [Streptomyces sp. NBC_01210]|uniref:hypothetical protein n=1 Tax=Streptomyces sp. NBC_01210 TaxID=2903774 RepID=UPI002E117BA1|nr:hypothetical protein OG735_07930 [Streptomyces sp. NBC_01210]
MSSWRSWHRPLMVFAASMAVVFVVSGVGMVVDDRVLVGSPIWFKPLKFSASLMIYALTLAWMLSLAGRGRRVGWWAGTVVALTGAIEIVIITGQVIRGKRSHFNFETAFDGMLFNIMGATIVTLWISSLIIVILLFRSPMADRAAAWAMRLGAAIALVGVALGNLMTRATPEQEAAGGRSVSQVVGAHSVGVPEGGPAMPLTGWSTTGGDLRIPHFVGMHALQLIPLFLLALIVLAPRFTRLRDERVRLRLVLVASGTYAAVLALVTWQALRGQPLIHPDGATLGAAALILVAAAAGALVSLLSTTPAPTPAQGSADDTEKELVA